MHSVVLEGDCLEVLRGMESDSVDALVTDPPAGISFMNKSWDSNKGSRNAWIAWLTEVMEEALRVMKPGAHGLVWALPRTSHWTAMALEDAGFEVRDRIAHHFGSGFPKSANVSKHIDRMAKRNAETDRRIAAVAQLICEHREAKGMTRSEVSEAVVGTPSGACWNWEHHQLPSVAMWEAIKETLGIPDDYDTLIDGNRSQWIAAEREVVGKSDTGASEFMGSKLAGKGNGRGNEVLKYDLTADATDEAKRWSGWHTALKPSTEDWWLVRKPLSESSVARQVLSNGCGAINIDASRVGTTVETWPTSRRYKGGQFEASRATGLQRVTEPAGVAPSGRWPANLLLSHVPGPNGCCPTGEIRRVKAAGFERNRPDRKTGNTYGEHKPSEFQGYADSDGTEEVEAWICARDEDGNFICPVALLDEQSGQSKSTDRPRNNKGGFGENFMDDGWQPPDGCVTNGHKDSGGASRFFKTFESSVEFHPDTHPGFRYQSKASRRDRSANGTVENKHPTCKNTELMKYLLTLVVPPGGVVLDPFAGSGSTLVAAALLNMDSIGIEKEEEYIPIIKGRLKWAQKQVQPENGKVQSSNQVETLSTLF